jgi:cytochrome c-type biogenesis protein CcmH/NrfF
VSPAFDVLATDGLAVIGTLGFFVPAVILVAVVVVAIVRDRRLAAQEEAEEAAEQARAHESLDDYEDVQGRPRTPPAD